MYGTLTRHIPFQKAWSRSGLLDELVCLFLSSARIWYALRVVKIPVGVPSHTRESNLVEDTGIDLIWAAFLGQKIESISCSFLWLVSGIAKSSNNWRGDSILQGCLEFIHLSYHILTSVPFLTRHLIPCRMTCLAWAKLLQEYNEWLGIFASMKEQSGKYLAF